MFEKHHVPFRLTTMYNNFIKTSHDTSRYHDTQYIDILLHLSWGISVISPGLIVCIYSINFSQPSSRLVHVTIKAIQLHWLGWLITQCDLTHMSDCSSPFRLSTSVIYCPQRVLYSYNKALFVVRMHYCMHKCDQILENHPYGCIWHLKYFINK